MKKYIDKTKAWATVAAFLLAAGCNSRVFVDDLAPSRTDVEFGMEGGVAQISFGSRTWSIYEIMVDGRYVTGNVTKNGKTEFMYNPVLDGCGEIVLTLSDGSGIEIRKTSGRKLEVRMDRNLSPLFRNLSFTVGNDVLTEKLYFRQREAEGLALERIEWDPVVEKQDTVLETGWELTVHNTSSEATTFHHGIFSGCVKRELFMTDDASLIQNLVKVPFSVPVPEKTDENGTLIFGGATAPFVRTVTETGMDADGKEIDISFNPGENTYEMLWEYVIFSARYKMYLKCSDGGLMTVTGTYWNKTPDGKYYGVWKKRRDGD